MPGVLLAICISFGPEPFTLLSSGMTSSLLCSRNSRERMKWAHLKACLFAIPHFLDSAGNVNIQAGLASIAPPSYSDALQLVLYTCKRVVSSADLPATNACTACSCYAIHSTTG